MPDRTACYDELQEPQKRGQATEAIIQSAFVLRDIPVLVPTYGTESYDLVVEVGGRFHRIQCKTAYRKREGTVEFETVSAHLGQDGSDRCGYDGRAAYFAVYDPINDNQYLIPVSERTRDTMELRVRESATDHRVGIDWAGEYRLENQLEELRRP
ncbi:group I intron-associated PD-(D/E)XK endonuclease [Natronorubrum bangense]|uniref:PD(D/E)XK endonuclease domain-containing protein n=2 Tax=Natronorubrum bangense TaxID=61858 RepID=L9WMD5_9EURY|nr:group I intron-associated PD-(D/E)XK endonuclease [Natronorubrum bangense]ELY50629.1 hypothetical protein C494_04600 [Natronorubrum bangense JCM 10635]QCC54471.1 hypothetical protein DV706_08215 [Natronorubrum bangense]